MNDSARPPGRIRAQARERNLHVILVEPEIPPNTGNIARLCAATCCPLHLVGKLGFSTDEHAVRRAGLDYWHLVRVLRHESLDAAEHAIAQEERVDGARVWLFSGRAERSYLDVEYAAGDALVFGKESTGLAAELLSARPDRVVGIPMPGSVRSLNLANAVAIAVYEALRQTGAAALAPAGPD